MCKVTYLEKSHAHTSCKPPSSLVLSNEAVQMNSDDVLIYSFGHMCEGHIGLKCDLTTYMTL